MLVLDLTIFREVKNMDTPKMPPTLEEFYKNPTGKGIVATNINIARKHYETRLGFVTGTEGKKVDVKTFIENDTSFYFLVTVPSDMGLNNYDVVIHAHDELKNSSSLKKWNVEFFSNCPSFIFTYANVYNEYGLLIPFLANKYNKKVLSGMPIEKNPDMLLGWDKSIYYALHTIMKNITFTQRFILKRGALPFDQKKFAAMIRTEDQIMEECKAGKTHTVIQLKWKESTLSKVSGVVKDAVKHVASNAVKSVSHSKIEGSDSSKRKYNVNTNIRGKIIGNIKIRGRRSHRRR